MLSDEIMAHFLQYINQPQKGNNLDGGSDSVCYFNIQLPKLSPNCQIVPGPEPELYVVQLLSGTIVIKTLPPKPVPGVTPRATWKKGHWVPLQNGGRVKDVIIAKIILEDYEFSINRGCDLHVIDPKSVNVLIPQVFEKRPNLFASF